MSPTKTEELRPDSSPESTKAAMSACVAQMMGEGMPQEQAVAACMNMTSKSMGREYKPKSTTIK
jgi:hypothetical protein